MVLERDDNDTILVRFPDFPEAHTFGEDRLDALNHAADALATVIDAYIKDRRPIPAASTASPRRRGSFIVSVPALTEAKVKLYEAMRSGKVGKAELAKRLGWHLPQVDRLIDVHHASRLDQLEAAFSVMGKRIVVSIEDVVNSVEAKVKSRKSTRPAAPLARRSSITTERHSARDQRRKP